MKQFRTIPAVLFVLLMAFVITSCKKDKINSNTKTFSVEKFKANLKTQMPASIVGYAVVISKDGTFADSINYGNAMLNPTGGANTPMTVNTYINIASVTKTFTAAAAMRLLEARNIPYGTKIKDYLPAYWNAHTDIENVTFHELLTHTSGIRESGTSYDSLRASCVRGLDGPKSGFYANANFALFRVMLPYIDNLSSIKAGENLAVNGNSTATFEALLSQKYKDLMQQYVFTPAGISNASCDPADVNGTLCQVFSEAPTLSGITLTTDWTEICGGGGYYMTTMQMARVLAFLGHSTEIISEVQRTTMNTNLYGCDPEDSPTTSVGRGHGKDGALIWQNTPVQGMQTYICRYPNGIDITISVNSIAGGQFRSLGGIALNAYEGAWE